MAGGLLEIIAMSKSEFARTAGFALLIVGTIGLVVNEITDDVARAVVLTFAVFNVAGLILISTARWLK